MQPEHRDLRHLREKTLTLADTGAGATEVLFISMVLRDTNTAGAAGSCAFAINGVNSTVVYPMGETTDTTDAGHPGETTMVGQFGGAVGDTSTYSIRRNENESDIDYRGDRRMVFTGAITG